MRIWKCVMCGRIFLSEEEWHQHALEYHIPTNKGKHVCDHLQCRRELESYTELCTHHISMHTRTYISCHGCQKEFDTEEEVLNHLCDQTPICPDCHYKGCLGDTYWHQ